MKAETIRRDQANAIWDILIQCAGASERPYERENFVAKQIAGEIVEWRFMGNLGFGGKFWRSNGRWYVNCYPEDENDQTREIVKRTNEKLAELREPTR